MRGPISEAVIIVILGFLIGGIPAAVIYFMIDSKWPSPAVSLSRDPGAPKGAVNVSVTESPAIVSSGRPPYPLPRSASDATRPGLLISQGKSCDDLTRMTARRFPPPWSVDERDFPHYAARARFKRQLHGRMLCGMC
jgi:hypothetical protein